MAIRKVARLGHPVLRQTGRKLSAKEILSTDIQRLIEDMVETMHEYGGVGLAAPQVHESLQLALVEFDKDNPRYKDVAFDAEQSLLVVINPKVKVLDKKEKSYWEGCLSVPGLRGLVWRPQKIQVEFLDAKAKAQKIVADGFLATVLQHELDHLEGILYIDRLKTEVGKTPLAFSEEYQRYLVSEDQEELE